MFEMIIIAFLMDGNTVIQKESFLTLQGCVKNLEETHYFVSQVKSNSFKGASFQCVKDQKVIVEKFYNVTNK